MAHTRQRRRLSLAGAVMLAVGVVLVALFGVTARTLNYEREAAVREALRQTERDALTLALNSQALVEHVTLVLTLVQALHEARPGLDLELLQQAGARTSALTRAVLLTDARGEVIGSTHPGVPPRLDDDDDFKRHVRHHDLGVTLAAPTGYYLGGTVVVAMAPLTTPDGRFDGVAVALIDAGLFTSSFASRAGEDHLAGVVGTDGIYRARLVGGQFSAGQQTDLPRTLEAAAAMRQTLEPRRSPIDGRWRFMSVQPVGAGDLIALVAIDASSVERSYRATRDRILAWAGALGIAVVLGGGLLVGQARALASSREATHRASQLYRATLNGSVDAVTILGARLDGEGRLLDFVIRDLNRSAAVLLGADVEQLIGRGLADAVPSVREQGFYPLLERAFRERVVSEGDYPARHGVAAGKWLHHQLVPIDDGVALISRDITEARLARDRLTEEATLDPLTGLTNRRSFDRQLSQAIERADGKGTSLALMYVDLDGFKQINDRLGHAAGDELLVNVAQRLVGCFRRTDDVARLGGDEFAVIGEDHGTEADLRQQCERVLIELSRPHALAGVSHPVSCTPSIGVARWRHGDADTAAALGGRADVAMYEAKRAGKGRFRLDPPAPGSTI